jgi:lysophospholipase L1-like esterase
VRELFLDLSAAAGIHYVDLYRPPEQDPFISHPDRYYAPDGLHPSGEGYRLWYEQLLEDTPMAQWLGRPTAMRDGSPPAAPLSRSAGAGPP